MKRIILSAAIISFMVAASLQKASAQETSTSSSFNLNIVLSDAISITLGASPDVTFTYSTAADYANSKTVSKTDHFSVVSNRAYDVTVVAGGEFSENVANTSPIPLSVVNIEVNRTSMAGTEGGSDATATLATTSQDLTTGANATIGSSFNVDFTIPTATDLVGKEADTYTTTVTYTATQL